MGFTALWPPNGDGKYIIQAEGIRMAFTNRNGGAPTNIWINDTNGREVDIILGLDKVEDYDDYIGSLGGTIGKRSLLWSSFQNENRLIESTMEVLLRAISVVPALRLMERGSTLPLTAITVLQRIMEVRKAGSE